ncbi:MAG TPA: hypothetical protein VIK75_07470 [Calditerricola sp.]|nr:hypothetical protein [Thermaerobacter sp. FW80]
MLAVLPPSEWEAHARQAFEALAERLGTSSVPEPLLRFEMRALALRRYGE